MRPLLAVLVLALALPLLSAIAAERVIDLTIVHGKLTGGQDTIRVQQGDDVVLRWHSDQPTVLHLHGYEIETRVMPGTVAETRFEARATGRFPVHVHSGRAQSESTLVYLEVYPE
jgi:FtsP/CotA-like multicopper oxidase with cupredoxin domain